MNRPVKGTINQPGAGAWAALRGCVLACCGRWAQDPAGGRRGVAEKWRPFVGEGVDICHTSTVTSGNKRHALWLCPEAVTMQRTERAAVTLVWRCGSAAPPVCD